MIRVQGNNNVKPIECVNPMRNKWRIHWDIQISTNESGAQEASYMEHEFTHRPTIEEVKNIITAYYNLITDQKFSLAFRSKAMRCGCQQKTSSTTRRHTTSPYKQMVPHCPSLSSSELTTALFSISFLTWKYSQSSTLH